MAKKTEQQGEVERAIAPITLWRQKESERYVAEDGKSFYVNFHKALNYESYKIHNQFIIKKASYEHQLKIICRYINYFISHYDQEMELVTAYLKLKFEIDRVDTRYNKDNMEAFIDLIYELMFTDSICMKIRQMVDENYVDDIEKEDASKYKKGGQEYLESLEFTNQHMVILLRVSFAMKIMSPVLFHFLVKNDIKLDSEDETIYLFYKRLLPLFQDNVDIFNKLYVYCKAKVEESKSHNVIIFNQKEFLGYDVYSLIKKFVRKILISENIVKYLFPENYNSKTKKYDESIVGFNKTIDLKVAIRRNA